MVRNSFYSFLLPHFEYCHSVIVSASDSNIKLLTRAFNQIKFLLPDLNINLDHRRRVGTICHFYKIVSNLHHPLRAFLPAPLQPIRQTRLALRRNERSYSPIHFNTYQFSRSFFPSMIELWNSLSNFVVNSPNIEIFKTRINGFLLS